MPVKNTANASTVPVDVEQGNRDQITPSASTSFARNEDISKPATSRRSLELEDAAPRNQNPLIRSPWAKFEAKLPAAVPQANRKIVSWMRGPEPTKVHHITPLLERIQTWPIRLLARLPRWIRACIYAVGFVLWAVLFGVILTNYSMPTNLAGFGAAVPLSCVTNLW